MPYPGKIDREKPFRLQSDALRFGDREEMSGQAERVPRVHGVAALHEINLVDLSKPI